VNSEGSLVFSNFFDDTGTIDLRDSSSSGLTFCALLGCNGVDGVEVHLLNDAFIDNDLLLDASSGRNLIDGGDIARIGTGDAYAGLNLVNLANATFVDSQYLLVTLNAFQDVNGDIVFPSWESFFGGMQSSTPATVDMENTADVGNNLTLTTESGANDIEADDSSTETGNAQAYANIVNQLNKTLVGGGGVTLMFRVNGSWAGQLFGAPDGVALHEDDGLVYLTGNDGSLVSGPQTEVHGASSALINNNGTLSALTGENDIRDARYGEVDTGNAYVGANVVNIANANVIGRNWILAIINIFGDFNGNISFGRPDLWVGEQVDVPSRIENGSDLTYKFTVINNGDAPATNVRLKDVFDKAHLSILDSSLDFERGPSGELLWDLGTLLAGGAIEVTYRARVKDTSPGTDMTNTVRASQRETDNNPSDNTDTATVTTSGNPAPSGGPVLPGVSQASVSLERNTADFRVEGTNRTVTQELTLTSRIDRSMFGVVLLDRLYGPDGKLLRSEMWPVGELESGETVKISYDLTFGDNAPVGSYTLTTELRSSEGSVYTLPNNGKILFLPGIESPQGVFETIFEVVPDGNLLSGEVKKAVSRLARVDNAHQRKVVVEMVKPQQVAEEPAPRVEDNDSQVAAAVASDTDLPRPLYPLAASALLALVVYSIVEMRRRWFSDTDKEQEVAEVT